jgi:hypothetical protein
MKIPSALLQMAYNIILNNVGSIAEAPLEKIPFIEVIAKAYKEEQPLEVIVGLYLQATENTSDDEIAGKVGAVLAFIDTEVPKILANVSEKPFKEVLGELLGDLSIPDFDDTEGNEKKVITLIDKVMDSLAD